MTSWASAPLAPAVTDTLTSAGSTTAEPVFLSVTVTATTGWPAELDAYWLARPPFAWVTVMASPSMVVD